MVPPLVFQIAAKIGGDVTGPPMSNNGGSESYPFASQKRSLEDGGTVAVRETHTPNLSVPLA